MRMHEDAVVTASCWKEEAVVTAPCDEGMLMDVARKRMPQPDPNYELYWQL
jgi:hypothetical protein